MSRLTLFLVASGMTLGTLAAAETYNNGFEHRLDRAGCTSSGEWKPQANVAEVSRPDELWRFMAACSERRTQSRLRADIAVPVVEGKSYADTAAVVADSKGNFPPAFGFLAGGLRPSKFALAIASAHAR
jgi:hypothetical protein